MSHPQYKKTGDLTTRVIEECSELIHILCKVQRFGWDNYHPNDKKKTKNEDLVKAEIKDVKDVIQELENSLK